MSVTSRPFAYNPAGTPIPGTTQSGDLTVGTPTNGFASTGLDWWNGPDEDLGYVIARGSSAQPTPIFENDISLSSTYKGDDINKTSPRTASITNGNKVQSILSTTLINYNDKVMFSLTFTVKATQSNNAWIGVGTLSMNFEGPTNGFPGNDNKSTGFNQLGQIFFDNNTIEQFRLPDANPCTWDSGNIIDVAVDHGNSNIWIRVNGGAWAGNPAGAIDPATNQGGLSLSGLRSIYPVLSPGTGGGNYGTMTLFSTPTYPVPTGFQFAGTNKNGLVGFLRSTALTDVSFVTLVNGRFNQSFALNAGGATLAKGWLNGQDYWTNYP